MNNTYGRGFRFYHHFTDARQKRVVKLKKMYMLFLYSSPDAINAIRDSRFKKLKKVDFVNIEN